MKFPETEPLKKRLAADLDLFRYSRDKTQKQDWIHISYKAFVDFFKNKKGNIKENDLIVGAYFAYGWMPTMLDLKGDIGKVVSLANKASLDEDLTKQDLEIIRGVVNNSLVGTSKLLHFINPERYPIWDSRVCYYVFDKKVSYPLIEKISHYISFKKALLDIQTDQQFKNIAAELFPHGYLKVSKIRALEYFMFMKGKKYTGKKR